MLAGVQQKLEKLQEHLVAMNFKKLKLEADVDNCEKVINLCPTRDGVFVATLMSSASLIFRVLGFRIKVLRFLFVIQLINHNDSSACRHSNLKWCRGCSP